jgi:transcriptional regulator with XRE-family HTH domain
MSDNHEEKILYLLRSKKFKPSFIAKCTGLNNTTIANYINGVTKPTKANLIALERFFAANSAENLKIDSNIRSNVCDYSVQDIIEAQKKTIEALKETVEAQKETIELQKETIIFLKHKSENSDAKDAVVADVG